MELSENILKNPLARFFWNESREGFVLEDERGVIHAASPGFAHMLGYAESELIGKGWSEITTPSDVEPGVNEMLKLFDGSIPEVMMAKNYQHKTGVTVPANTRVMLAPKDVVDALGMPSKSIIVFAQALRMSPAPIAEVTTEQRREIISAELGQFVITHGWKIVLALLTLVGIVRADYLVAIIKKLVAG